nr:MAG TPA: hypothetical protein [Crassvirales sp.]
MTLNKETGMYHLLISYLELFIIEDIALVLILIIPI